MLIHPSDNVEVREDGHKYAVRPIQKGERVVKYGFPIGLATEDVAVGDHVHSHNLSTLLSGKLEYEYRPALPSLKTRPAPTFLGYERADGTVGIRNDVWILPTVGCVNGVGKAIAEKTGAKFFPHPYGRSQLGDDQTYTQLILKGMVNHPNAGGVLVLGLGCENNHIDLFRKVLGSYDEARVRFLCAQEVEDEIAEGVRLVRLLQENAAKAKRTPVSLSRLCIGLKCGGSDGFSGIVANPLVGRFTDAFVGMGGRCVLTEVPEMFGAEQLLMERCVDRATFDKTVRLINDFKDYYARHNMPVYENPSPGNKAGGITTLEEKSLGCIQKGGHAPVVDVIGVGETVKHPGLTLLDGPGNDMVSITNLMAAGCQLILFTTGRGTPLGTAVPTVKIASNAPLAKKKASWIDLDASREDEEALLRQVQAVAEGKTTKNEENGMEEIAIFKNGVTL